MDEEASRRNIAMTCHTDNLEAEKAYLYFTVENVEPQLKPQRQFTLSNRFTSRIRSAKSCQPNGLQVFDRDVKNHVELFRQENVPLETEEAKLGQQYQKLIGAQTVNFRGEEKTLVQMGRYLEEPDRALRQEALGTGGQTPSAGHRKMRGNVLLNSSSSDADPRRTPKLRQLP